MTKKKTALKKVDINTVIEVLPIKVLWFDYQCIYTGLMKPMNEAGINRLAEEVTDWARNDVDAFKISQFYLHKGISRKVWLEWCDRYPRLQQANESAKQLIGNRREIGALKHELNYGPVSFTMPFYDADWKDESIRRAALKDVNSEAKSSISVTMYPIPNSPLVPDKPD
jgi:hypothetical protein